MYITNAPPVVTGSATLARFDTMPPLVVQWTVTDAGIAGATYEVIVDDIVKTPGTWTSGQVITYAAGTLPVGTANFTLRVLDGLGLATESTTLVTTSQNSAPVFTLVPDNVTRVEGGLVGLLTWLAEDATTAGEPNYKITLAGEVVASGWWVPGIEIHFEPTGELPVGTHIYEITLSDGAGLTATSKISVTIDAVGAGGGDIPGMPLLIIAPCIVLGLVFLIRKYRFVVVLFREKHSSRD